MPPNILVDTGLMPRIAARAETDAIIRKDAVAMLENDVLTDDDASRAAAETVPPIDPCKYADSRLRILALTLITPCMIAWAAAVDAIELLAVRLRVVAIRRLVFAGDMSQVVAPNNRPRIVAAAFSFAANVPTPANTVLAAADAMLEAPICPAPSIVDLALATAPDIIPELNWLPPDIVVFLTVISSGRPRPRTRKIVRTGGARTPRATRAAPTALLSIEHDTRPAIALAPLATARSFAESDVDPITCALANPDAMPNADDDTMPAIETALPVAERISADGNIPPLVVVFLTVIVVDGELPRTT